MQVVRQENRHDLSDLTVAIRFQGDYDESYTAGENRAVLPTDTMKNTVYALASRMGPVEPEVLGLALARHFLDRNPRLAEVRVDLSARAWARIHRDDGAPDGFSFIGRGPDVRTASITAAATGTLVSAGIADLLILKSSRSAFAGFLRDELTTLPDTTDRLLATSLSATWQYRDAHGDFGPLWRQVRQALLDTFADHDSASVQHTLYAMGEAALTRVAALESIRLVMPNKHHLPVDLRPFGLENRNEIFVATDEPHGLIEATVSR